VSPIDEKTAQAMKTAIEMEISGHKFFTNAAKRVESEVGKKLFGRLAQEELLHLQVFEKIFGDVSRGVEWKVAVRSVEPEVKVPYFDEAKKNFKPKDLTLELDFLKKALDLERRAMEFFEKAATDAEDEAAQEIFKKVKEQEQLHYDLIQAEIDHLSGSGFWFDVREFDMDGKF
jgi:rubrerythrin